MAVLQSAVAVPWAAATPVQAAAAVPWGAATPMQSIGSPYTRPAPPSGSTVVSAGSLAPRTEILPAASYRSTAVAVVRNVRVVGEAEKYFNAPLKTGPQDIRAPAAVPSFSGTPTFDGDGMTCAFEQALYYQPATVGNEKLHAENYTVGLTYRVRVRKLSAPVSNSSTTPVFTVFGFQRQVGFLVGPSGTLRSYDVHVSVAQPEVSFGAIPDDCVLSIVYPPGSGRAQLRIDDATVYTSPIDVRFESGVSVGLPAFVSLTSLKFSELRLERPQEVTNGISIRDGEVINAASGSIDLPDGAALWRLSTTVPRAAYDAMRAGEQPPLVSVSIAGRQWVFVVDEMSAPRAFASTDVSIRGVSLAALADAPYELSRQWTSDAPTTAAQIATLANTFTGLNVAWQLPDWPVPAGAWSFSGTPWGAVLQPAAAVQAVVEAAPAALGVTVTSRYPIMPNEWHSTPPDVQVPWVAVESENVVAADRPGYTGVFVAGPATTVAAVRLAGTAGAEQAPLVTGELLTDLAGQVELGRTILAASGGAQIVTRSLQVLDGAGQPGVIARGALVRWVDPAETWVGMVRSQRVDWEFGRVRQTVACERRISFPVGTFVPEVVEPTDPLWAQVVLLLKAEGTDAKTVTDSSSHADHKTAGPSHDIIADRGRYGGGLVINNHSAGGIKWTGSRFTRPAGVPMTIELSFKRNSSSFAGGPPLLWIYDAVNSSQLFQLSAYATFNQVSHRWGQGNAFVQYDVTADSDGWYFCVMQIDSSDNASLWVNGNLLTTQSGYVGVNPIFLCVGGSDTTDLGSLTFPCSVAIDELRITMGALRHAGTPPATQGPTFPVGGSA